MAKQDIQTFCLDGRCDYFRHTDTIYRDLIDVNENNEKNIFSFRHFISCE